MTLDEARARIGSAVVYRASHPGAAAEQGIITSVNDAYVFVRYGSNPGSAATRPEDLTFLTGERR